MIMQIVLPLVAGLAIFLFGMKSMELALHLWAAPYLKQALYKLTRTPFRGLLTGAGTTAVLQSSSAVTVITIGMVNAGVITFPQTLGIILGTNIGTTVTTELIGLNINHLALPLLISSFIVWVAAWSIAVENLGPILGKTVSALRHLSLAVGGFACVLLGMVVMESIVPALQSRGLFAWFLEQSQRSLVWGIIAGTALTAVIQSSAATIAITMGLAAVQAISAELGIAIVLGANIGTCITGFIASIGGNRYGQYVAWAHVILNICGAVLFYPFIPELFKLSAFITPDPSVQLAHAQTIYNLICSFLALPFLYLPFLNNIDSR
ncbi:Na/Pi cotransporter family protein [Ferviditalea candida]|uniref:Na/Pi symporter n=1 Tax=Ferviditalea candida TaxID=3108399 RepID=A0ABU5ZDW1_9BACL|nr:Na/Pi symporter [Paenibacillaceae bacterium T2]